MGESAQLCKGHNDQLYDGVLADFLAHPDGVCSETCGCMTMEDLCAKYGDNFEDL